MIDTPLPPMNPEVARLRRQSAQRKYRKRLRHTRLLWLIAGGLLLVLLIEVLFALAFSPRFWVYRITVKNTETFREGEIIRLMHLPAGSNWFRVRLGKLADRVRTDPRVDTVTVKHGTVGALEVDVQERQAVCQLTSSGMPLYLDARGYVFSRPLPPSSPVPMIEGITVPPVKRVLGTQYTPRDIRAVLDCLQQFRTAFNETPLSITRIVIAPNGWMNLVLRQGTRVFIGDTHELPLKIWSVKKAMLKASGEGYSLDQLEYINVRYVNKDTGKGISYLPKHHQEATVTP